MNERQQKVIENIIGVCSFMIAKANPAEREHFIDVLMGENRALFVSLIFHCALATDDRSFATQMEFDFNELKDAINPKRHWIEEKEIVDKVLSAVEMKISSHIPR